MANHHISNTEAATDEPAFVSTFVGEALDDSFAQTSRCRHDGWTPERMAGFIRALAACGVVADACRSVGMSAQSAYSLRNRRAGRAFATAWDAVLVHRARIRLGDELMSRSMNGWVERVERDGVAIGERHRHDNRLAMAVLTRLDRLAEKTEGEAQTLRAVSEDLDDFLDCLEQGGDADAFVEERKAAEPETDPAPTPSPPVNKSPYDEFDRLALIAGCSDWRHVSPFEVPVDDLDPDRKEDWDIDAWIRAERSGYLVWLAMFDEDDEWDEGDDEDERPFGDECAEAFNRAREEALERVRAREGGDPGAHGPEAHLTQPSTSSTSLAAEDRQQDGDAPPPIGDCADAISL